VSLDDQTTQTAMLAVQGPATMGLLGDHLPMKIGELPRFGFVSGSYMGQKYSVFRSGYTGEDGVEVILPAGVAVLAWEYLTREGTGGRAVVRPAGLGARDTLRLEAAMPLYGHELGEQADPLSAGCGWCVDLNKEFIGAAALRRVRTEGPKRRIAGLVLEGKRIARQGSRVMTGDRAVGEVTSGTLSPTLEKSIALAYVDSGALDAGAGLSVEIRDQRVGASVVSLPFYKRAG
jgi:aminomethyltransferase